MAAMGRAAMLLVVLLAVSSASVVSAGRVGALRVRHSADQAVADFFSVVDEHHEVEKPLQPAEAAGGGDAPVVHWALLVAGSMGYGNYRHQADICHAYQLLHRGGLKDENIVVMMYDDIANNVLNPHKGVIINNPSGKDVYHGVPKDYTGADVNAATFLRVLAGDKAALSGVGSGKVIASGPNDFIFVYYSDHGGPGKRILGMPSPPFLYANDFNNVVKQKAARKGFDQMVIYVEACESGSIFEGLLPDNLNVYVTTASNAVESSWGTYCPGMSPHIPMEYSTCLGDLYSVAWMEDSDTNDLTRETLLQQYDKVKFRTSSNGTFNMGSHVMQYGDLAIDRDEVADFIGNPVMNPDNSLFLSYHHLDSKHVKQRDANLVHLMHRYTHAAEATAERQEAFDDVMAELAHRKHVDHTVDMLPKLLLGSALTNTFDVFAVREAGQPTVNDWDCYKSAIAEYEIACGPLEDYGMRHGRIFANLCNFGVTPEEVHQAATLACSAS
eukprot:jgi/Chlat1/3896/Chrsp26S08862